MRTHILVEDHVIWAATAIIGLAIHWTFITSVISRAGAATLLVGAVVHHVPGALYL